ncbi:uncharacterized protein N7515_006492 [Penicillium bovifimosum]|uniref:Uncharacterized protein n=1 Tax=Penicillium bovifimosum TaxID=126998 RepID=A0A9W9GV34_9EURO|nr:uncharacterized protein N7515_006492 [Penicillium bovifimosum]KAJ5130453.1 hypothetical protein N7515_006492 [Penicillium bovifimosum]
MATEGTSMQANANSADTAEIVKEHSHAFQNRLNTTQTDSDPAIDTAKPKLDGQERKAATEVEPATEVKPATAVEPATEVEPRKSAADTEPPVAEQTTEESTAADNVESSVGSVPIAAKSQETLGPMNETKVGEKRDLDSTVTPVPAGTATNGPEPLEGPGSKKAKTDKELVPGHNGTTAAPSKAEDEKPKKDSRSKTEKIKDAVKKVVHPGDGVGSRTRSRTKDT